MRDRSVEAGKALRIVRQVGVCRRLQKQDLQFPNFEIDSLGTANLKS